MGNYSLGIDTAFATMSDQSTHNLAILGQPKAHTLPDATPAKGKTHTFSQIAVIFGPSLIYV